MPLDAETAYRAVLARDRRFDGHFFVGSRSTGTYCRPVCRARKPARRGSVFFDNAAQAERAGFRACFRCRPERSPGVAQLGATSGVVGAALARIEAGALLDGSLESLASGLGVTSRHLRRAMQAELGVSPVALAQSRRLALARELADSATVPMTEVAFASGFRSLRRFNALFKAAYGAPPSSLRSDRHAALASESVVMRLEYRPPYDWPSLLALLDRWRVPGVESVLGLVYTRTCRVGEYVGRVAVYPVMNQPALIAEISPTLLRVLAPVVASLRRLFDLDADIQVIETHLAQDARLRPLVRARPGLRFPGAFDPFETAVRAALGKTACARLVARYGTPFVLPYARLTHLFPTARALAGLPAAERAQDPAASARTLMALRAGPRVDAFPSSDRDLKTAMTRLWGRQAVPTEGWSPWRAYAAMHVLASTLERPRTGPSSRATARGGEMRFTGRVMVGHDDVHAVIVPFDPTQCWGVRLGQLHTAHGRRLGTPVRGSVRGVPFDGFIGFRWGRFYIILEPELRRRAQLGPGDPVEVTVCSRRTSGRRAAHRP